MPQTVAKPEPKSLSIVLKTDRYWNELLRLADKSGVDTLASVRANIQNTVPDAFNESLANLKSSEVQVSEWEAPFVFGAAPVQVVFTGGTKLRADYWRLMQGGKALISSFDHKQQYGLPIPFDAIEELRKALSEKVVTGGKIDRETGDLHFEFSGNVSLHIFNVSGYEVWEVNFPGGTCEYSNYNR